MALQDYEVKQMQAATNSIQQAARNSQAEDFAGEIMGAHGELTHLMDRLVRVAELTQYARLSGDLSGNGETKQICPEHSNKAIADVQALRSRVRAATDLVNGIIDTL